MSTPLSSASRLPVGVTAERVSELQSRIQGMQRERFAAGGRALPGSLARLSSDGSLRNGVVYTVENSTSLVMALLGAARANGEWSAVVGVPDFGIEAAVSFGIDLERLVLVPDPGEHWMAVTAALVDVLPLVVVAPRRTVRDAEAARLAARLRQTGCTLIVAGAWPQSEAELSVSGTRWEGLGVGHGNLSGRAMTVGVTARNGTGRRRWEQVSLPEVPGSVAQPPLPRGLGGPVRSGNTQIPATG